MLTHIGGIVTIVNNNKKNPSNVYRNKQKLALTLLLKANDPMDIKKEAYKIAADLPMIKIMIIKELSYCFKME